MSNLYKINQEILDCIDLETGEIVDTDKFDRLQLERNDKLENIALYYKNLLSDAAAFKAEKDAFAEREKQAKSKADSLKNYLDASLKGSKFETTRVNIGYRKSKSLEYDGIADVPEDYLKHSDPTIDKKAITDAIKSGEVVEGFTLKENNNIQIK